MKNNQLSAYGKNNNKGLRQLSDDKFYIETNIDLTDTHSKIINKKIADMYEDKEINFKCHD